MNPHASPANPLGFIPTVPSLEEAADMTLLVGAELSINNAFPGLKKNEPTALLLDINNLYRRAGQHGFRVDYGKLKNIFEQRCDLRYAAAFSAIDPTDVSSDRWIKFMRKADYSLHIKDLKRYTDSEGEPVTKGNMDLELAFDALNLSPAFSHIVIGTCDGDFVPLIEELRKGKFRRVSVLGLRGREWAGMSRDLVTAAKEADGHFYDLTQIQEYIRYQGNRHDAANNG